jgi:hypothetical protein
MPSAVPAGSEASLPPARMIDPRGHRFGAGVSAVLLLIAVMIGAAAGVAAWRYTAVAKSAPPDRHASNDDFDPGF